MSVCVAGFGDVLRRHALLSHHKLRTGLQAIETSSVESSLFLNQFFVLERSHAAKIRYPLPPKTLSFVKANQACVNLLCIFELVCQICMNKEHVQLFVI